MQIRRINMKFLKKIVCTFFATILFNVSLVVPVLAAEGLEVVELESTVTAVYDSLSQGIQPRSTTFLDTSITIGYDEEGMHVAICTDLNGVGSVVGAKDINVQIKNGSSWTTVATSAGGGVTDATGCIISFTYADAVKGETYRVTCIHYGNVDEYRELYHESEGFKCTY